jgi:photosystem II stability/assembly factor-like uncharacterized protein
MVVWISGLAGTVGRTTDGGNTWRVSVVPGADSLQFRDIHAVDSSTAYLLSAGTGEASRIYKTTDGGHSWSLKFTNPEPDAFFDCMAFWDDSSGLAFSDAVRGSFIVLGTADGEQWEPIEMGDAPPALPGEGSFAASGTCIATRGDSSAWFGTGASTRPRVYRTRDRGWSWSVHDTPVVGGSSSSGIMSLAFRDTLHGMVAGGDLQTPDDFADNVGITADGGLNWELAARPTFPGAVYGLALVPGSEGKVVAVGPGGAAYSQDFGMSWVALDTLDYWSAAFGSSSEGWLVGPDGRIAKITLQ